MDNLKGICPILPGTFKENGEIDYDSLENVIKVLKKGGCEGVVLFGIATEYYKLDKTEKEKMLKIAIKTSKQVNVKSVVNITEHSTLLAEKEAIQAEKSGADYLMLLPPFFLKPTYDDIIYHIKKICKTVSIPVILQYNPGVTGVTIACDVFTRLSIELKNLFYYKIENIPPGKYITKLSEGTNSRIKILVGWAGLHFIEALDRGAIGVMPGSSLFDIYVKIYKDYSNGNRGKAIELHNKLLPFLNFAKQVPEMLFYYEKKILKIRGIIKSDYCRKPAFIPDEYYSRLFNEYYQALIPYLDY